MRYPSKLRPGRIGLGTGLGMGSGISGMATVAPPSAPANLATVAASGSGGATLTWNAAVGALTYNVYRGATPGSETLYAAGVSLTTYTDPSPATANYYTVTAANNGGESSQLSEVSYSTDGAVSLVAASSQYLTAPHIGLFDGATAFSVSVWFKLATISAARFLFEQGHASPNLQISLATTGSNKLIFRLSGNGTSQVNSSGGTVFAASTIYHALWVFDGTQLTDITKCILYVNGVAETLGTVTGSPIPTAVFNASSNAPLAALGVNLNGITTPMNGTIGSPVIWNRALTPTESAVVYNGGFRQPVERMLSTLPSGAIAGWGMKSSGTLLVDNIDSETLTAVNSPTWAGAL